MKKIKSKVKRVERVNIHSEGDRIFLRSTFLQYSRKSGQKMWRNFPVKNANRMINRNANRVFGKTKKQ